MPQFNYTARKRDGQLISGSISADTQRAAIEQLRETGCVPIKIEHRAASAAIKNAGHKNSHVAEEDVLGFTRQLARLLESGVPMERALELLSANSPSPAMCSVSAAILNDVRGGATLSSALFAHPSVFPEIYTGMVQSGEAVGTLTVVLRRLADHFERRRKLSTQIWNSLMYPAFMLGVGIITVVFLIAFVIPRFQKVFDDIGQTLPWPTKALMSLGSFSGHNWWVFAALAVFAIIAVRAALESPAARSAWHRAILNIPTAGRLFRLSALARFTRVLGALLQNGLPILSAIELATSNTGNDEITRRLAPVRTSTSDGVALAVSFRDTALFDAFTIDITTVAEETGTLPLALIEIAEHYDEDVLNSLQRLTAMLEPALIVCLGIIVAFIVSAMLLPILQLNLTSL